MASRKREERTPYERFSVSLTALAEELGMHKTSLKNRAIRMGMEMHRRKNALHGRYGMHIGPMDAERLKAFYKETRISFTEMGDLWMTGEQVVAALKIASTEGLKERIKRGTLKIERRQVIHSRDLSIMYNPFDVAKEQARLGIKPQTMPQGTYTSAQVAEILGIADPQVIRLWGHKRGARYNLTTKGISYWNLKDIRAYLVERIELRGQPCRVQYRRYLARLEAWEAEQASRASTRMGGAARTG